MGINWSRDDDAFAASHQSAYVERLERDCENLEAELKAATAAISELHVELERVNVNLDVKVALADVEIAELKQQLEAVRGDFASLESDAAAVVDAYSDHTDNHVDEHNYSQNRLYRAIRSLQTNGRDGWVESALARGKKRK
jgi:SMC interacting uncharacterized protein involved in chromosome segregation